MTICFDGQKGSAMILTMLISAVVITVGIGFNWLVKEHLKAAEGLKNKTEAMVKARSAYDTLIYALLTGTLTSRDVKVNTGSLHGVKAIPLNGEGISVNGDTNITVQDSNGMLSLVNLDIAVMERLLKIVRPGKKSVSDITDSLLDWTDRDRLVRVNGAEEAFYRSEGRSYAPRDYSLQYKEELSLIKGMDKDLYKSLSPVCTLLPGTGFNPNTAGDEALMAYLDIDKVILENLRRYMNNKAVTSDAEIFPITGKKVSRGEGVHFYPSRFCDVTVNVGSPKTVYTIRAGVDLRPLSATPYSVIYWKEE